jgi:CheY-like chemotaxis protein
MAEILVIDDQNTNRKLAHELLTWSGHAVFGASSAEEALQSIRQHAPDLILMDIALPGMDGLTLAKLLKADPSTKGIRIVAVTAFAMRGDEERMLAAGCDGYLPKPIDTRRFPSQVAEFLLRKTDSN